MKKKRIAAVLLAAMMLMIGCFTATSYGASGTKSMTAYDVIKKGNTVYCAARLGVYKVNLKNGKVKKLYSRDKAAAWINGGAFSMKLYKNHIYFLTGGAMTDSLWRVKTSGGKAKLLTSGIMGGYAISNDRIYFKEFDFDAEDAYNQVMSLTGKNKKYSSYSAKMTTKRSNKKGYYIKSVLKGETSDGDYRYTDYLVKPNGRKIKLCTYSSDY